MNTAVMDIVRIGIAASAFILVAKLVFVGLIKVPGLSTVVGAI